jgi:hypothetical protein
VTVHDMDVMAEPTGLILFHTEFGIPSIPPSLEVRCTCGVSRLYLLIFLPQAIGITSDDSLL